MFSSPLISIFSQSGLDKLIAIKQKLEALKSRQFQDEEISDYSRTMLDNVIVIVSSMISNNNISYWKKEKNANELAALINVIDNSKGTFVPEVFNEHSYVMATLLLEAINSINLQDDLNGLAATALSALVGAPQKLIEMIKQNIQFKINFYQMMKDNHLESSRRNDLIMRRVDEITALERTIESETFDESEFRTNYVALCENVLQDIESLPYYLGLANPASFINTKKPYSIIPDEIVSVGNRARYINFILNVEKDISMKLKAKGLSPVIYFFRVYKEKFNEAAVAHRETQLTCMCDNLYAELDEYIDGAHLKGGIAGFFKGIKGVDTDKKTCVSRLKKNMANCMQDATISSTSLKSFEIFKFLLSAILYNEFICSQKNISLGELSRIFNNAVMRFFTVAFFETNEVNDVLTARKIKKELAVMQVDEAMLQVVSTNRGGKPSLI